MVKKEYEYKISLEAEECGKNLYTQQKAYKENKKVYLSLIEDLDKIGISNYELSSCLANTFWMEQPLTKCSVDYPKLESTPFIRLNIETFAEPPEALPSTLQDLI